MANLSIEEKILLLEVALKDNKRSKQASRLKNKIDELTTKVQFLQKKNIGLEVDYPATASRAAAEIASKGREPTPERIINHLAKNKQLELKRTKRQTRTALQKVERARDTKRAKKYRAQKRKKEKVTPPWQPPKGKIKPKDPIRQLKKEVGGISLKDQFFKRDQVARPELIRTKKVSTMEAFIPFMDSYQSRRRKDALENKIMLDRWKAEKRIQLERLLKKEKNKIAQMTDEQREKYLARKENIRKRVKQFNNIMTVVCDPVGAAEKYVKKKTRRFIRKATKPYRDLKKYIKSLPKRSLQKLTKPYFLNVALEKMLELEEAKDAKTKQRIKEELDEIYKDSGLKYKDIKAVYSAHYAKKKDKWIEQELKSLEDEVAAREEIVDKLKQDENLSREEILRKSINQDFVNKEKLLEKAKISSCADCGRVILNTRYGSRGSQCHHGYSKASNKGA